MRAMARRAAEHWADIVAEAEQAGVSHAQVALKHRVSLSTLRYHVYKARRGGASKPSAPRLLPIRVDADATVLEAQVGAVRLRFAEGCNPSYVAAVLSALSNAPC
jgi:transposase-like protein